jgi:hypothetical protein
MVHRCYLLRPLVIFPCRTISLACEPINPTVLSSAQLEATSGPPRVLQLHLTRKHTWSILHLRQLKSLPKIAVLFTYKHWK